jgi:KUP system potassium uptake protein
MSKSDTALGSQATATPAAQTSQGAETRTENLQNLMLGAIGVVFGDIGTSPLYTIQICMTETGDVTHAGVMGILSLIVWSLITVVTMKYVVVVMRADNRGEGGILALTALALRGVKSNGRLAALVLAAGMAGAALFYGDGVITPAISVLSAVEGLKVIAPGLEEWVLPLTVTLLLGLFAVQRRGTSAVGRYFGPITALWFLALASAGLHQIILRPQILEALNPYWGAHMLLHHPWKGFVLLGAVVLAVTGAEALYADMGHFGRKAISRAWLYLVFPALLLNYFGQGAHLLDDPAAVDNPFFRLYPTWALIPMVILASAATIIASQAVISGAFSMTNQAVQLGYLPRMEVRHTSASERGQIYVPKINLLLLIAVVALVLGFKTSGSLGAAYGIAVTGTMSLTTSLALLYMVRVRGWNPLFAGLLFGLFLLVDLAFFGANMLKVAEGGWAPLLIGISAYLVMSTWTTGRRAVMTRRSEESLPVEMFLSGLKPDRPIRVPGTALFLTADVDKVPASLMHNLKHNKVLHERVILLNIKTLDIPRVPDDQRLEIRDLGHQFYTIVTRYGFVEEPDIWRVLAQCRAKDLRFNMMETSVFVGREKLVISNRTPLAKWRKELFLLLFRLSLSAVEFFRVPSNRVVELGGQTEF